MSRIKQLFRIFVLSLLGLLGTALLLEGLWFAWQGEPIGGVLMVVATGGMLAGCAGWLLFLAPPPQPTIAHKPVVESAPSSGSETPAENSAPVRVITRYQHLTNDTPLPLATPDELRAALVGIGIRRLTGATWQEATEDERWANFSVFLHCERDKLGESSDDVDGLYLTREEAEAAASASPQAANSYVWKVFVSASALQYLSDDRKVLPHLVRAIKQELFALPVGHCPGTLVELKSWQAGRKAWLDSSGQNVVLFEDENVLDGLMFSSEPQTGVFKTDSGMGLFDESGAIVLPPRYEDIEHFYSGLAAAKLNGLWGFLDQHDHWQIEPRFVEVRGFINDEHSKARTENGWGLIDRQGAWIVADRYAEIAWFNRYRGGLNVAAIRRTEAGLWGAIQVSSDEAWVIDSAKQQGDQLIIEAIPAAYQETLVVDCVCTAEDEVEEHVHDYLEALKPKRESVSRLRAETEAVDYHCNYCGRKIGDYDALRAAGFHVDKYDRVYCSDACSTKAFMGASREYEGRGGDY